MIELAAPWWLALLPLPFVLQRILPPRVDERDAVYAPFVERLAEALGLQSEGGVHVLGRRLLQWLGLALGWGSVLLALARPQWVGEPETRTVATRDLLLAVDLSGSMEAEDFTDASGAKVDRLTAVKGVLDDFLARREGDRVGLVVFGTAAFLQAPFTEDLDACRLLLDETQVRMAGPRTALGDALGLSLALFEESELEERTVILLTDGNDTGSRVPPEKAAAIAADRGVQVHVVAVGDPTTVGEDRLDERALREIARLTGGTYAHAADRDALEGVYADLDALDTREVETRSHRPRRELYIWPLGFFVVMSALLVAIFTWWRGAPDRALSRAADRATPAAEAAP